MDTSTHRHANNFDLVSDARLTGLTVGAKLKSVLHPALDLQDNFGISSEQSLIVDVLLLLVGINGQLVKLTSDMPCRNRIALVWIEWS